jgi:hypothetical protein
MFNQRHWLEYYLYDAKHFNLNPTFHLNYLIPQLIFEAAGGR